MRIVKMLLVIAAVIAVVTIIIDIRGSNEKREDAMRTEFQRLFDFRPSEARSKTTNPMEREMVEMEILRIEIQLCDQEEGMKNFIRALTKKASNDEISVRRQMQVDWCRKLSDLKKAITVAAYFGFLADYSDCSSDYWNGVPIVYKHQVWAKENFVETVTP